MKRLLCWSMIPWVLLLGACAGPVPRDGGPQELPLLEHWAGDYPVTALDRLPVGQRDAGVGWLDPDSFAAVWAVLQGGALPSVDFEHQLVVFVRNTDFYNRTSIFKVKVVEGVAEVLAMETMSAIPVEERVAMALAVVPRAGITALRVGDRLVPLVD